MKITSPIVALAAILALCCAPTLVKADDSNAMTAPAAPMSTDTNTTAPSMSSDKAPSMKPTPYSGSITAMDASSVTVAGTSKTMTLAVTADTKYKVGKKKAMMTDFKVGDMVTGSFMTDSTGAMTAKSVHKKAMSK